MTLRRLEKENRTAFEDLRSRIFKKYKIRGLHISEFVQNGIFDVYVTKFLEFGLTKDEVKTEIGELFDKIETKTSFIQIGDKIDSKAGEIISKIQAHSPKIFIIFSCGSATKIFKKIEEKVRQKISDYDYEIRDSESKLTYLLIRRDKLQ